MNTESIGHNIKTALRHGPHRPFGITPMTKQPIKPTDPSTLQICDDPLPAHRYSSKKYDDVLSQMKIGQCLKCKLDEVERISGAVRNFIKEKKLKAKVCSVKDYGDGFGRVWMLPL